MPLAICRPLLPPDTEAEAGVRVLPMPVAVCRVIEALCAVTVNLPIGTNLGLLHFLWMQVSGNLLSNPGVRRGLFPALQAIGLLPGATRRAWAAFPPAYAGAGRSAISFRHLGRMSKHKGTGKPLPTGAISPSRWI